MNIFDELRVLLVDFNTGGSWGQDGGECSFSSREESDFWVCVGVHIKTFKQLTQLLW